VLLLFAAVVELGAAELRVAGENAAYVGLGPLDNMEETAPSWE
jgi:hypothetical protein